MPTTTPPAKVKVRCSQVRVCGWSGERRDPGSLGAVADRPCPWCLRRSVVLVGRTPNPTLALVELARARLSEEH